VRLDQPFMVSPRAGRPQEARERLEFPGDPSGSPANVVNCRCTMLPILDEESYQEAKASSPDLGNLPQVSDFDDSSGGGFGPTTDREAELHRNSFLAEDETLRGAIRNTDAVGEIQEGRSEYGGSSYKPSDRLITHKPREGADEDRVRSEWRHEYGHHMDEATKPAGKVSKVERRISEQIDSDTNNLLSRVPDKYDDEINEKASDLRLYGDTDELKQRAKDAGVPSVAVDEITKTADRPKSALADLIVGEEDDALEYTLNTLSRHAEAGSQLQDLFGSLTETKVGGGHMESYYDGNKLRQSSEMWADYISIRGASDSGIKQYMMQVIEEYAPRSKSELDAILKEMADGNF